MNTEHENYLAGVKLTNLANLELLAKIFLVNNSQIHQKFI